MRSDSTSRSSAEPIQVMASAAGKMSRITPTTMLMVRPMASSTAPAGLLDQLREHEIQAEIGVGVTQARAVDVELRREHGQLVVHGPAQRAVELCARLARAHAGGERGELLLHGALGTARRGA